MKFAYKNAAEIAAMTPEQQDKYATEKREAEAAERKAEQDALFDQFKELLAASETKSVTEMKAEYDKFVEQMKSNISAPQNGGIDIAKAITDNITEIKSVYAAKTGSVVLFEQKAPARVMTTNGDIPAPGLPDAVGTMLAPLGEISLREMGILPLVNTGRASQPVYVYTEAYPKEGDFAVVLEGEVKPMVDIIWETRSITPKKIAAVTKITEEAATDVVGLEDTIRNYLFKKHNLKKSKLVLSGDGVGDNPKGIIKYGRTFVAGAMAGQVSKPNIMDVINAAITNVYMTHNYEDEIPYMPNVALMNPIDFFVNFVSAKDAFDRPLFPTATMFNKVVIGSVTIVPEQTIVAGKILVADLSKYNVLDYVGYTVRVGWENDDMRRNQFMLIAESRFYQFVKKADELAFIYDDIATIKTAIAKPVTP